MHKAIKKNITEYNDGIYNFIVDLIDENNDYFVQKVQIDAKDDAPRFSNKDYLIENGTKILKQKILKLVGLFGLDVKYNLVGFSINTLNFYPKTQYMNNC